MQDNISICKLEAIKQKIMKSKHLQELRKYWYYVVFIFFIDFCFYRFSTMSNKLTWEVCILGVLKAHTVLSGCFVFSHCPIVRWPSAEGQMFWRNVLNNHTGVRRGRPHPNSRTRLLIKQNSIKQYFIITISKIHLNLCITKFSDQRKRPEQRRKKEWR